MNENFWEWRACGIGGYEYYELRDWDEWVDERDIAGGFSWLLI